MARFGLAVVGVDDESRAAGVLGAELLGAPCWAAAVLVELRVCATAAEDDAALGDAALVERSCANNPSEAAAKMAVRNTPALVMQASKLWLFLT